MISALSLCREREQGSWAPLKQVWWPTANRSPKELLSPALLPSQLSQADILLPSVKAP